MRLNVVEVDSPIGVIVMAEADGILRALDFADFRPRMQRGLRKRFGMVELEPSRDVHGFARRLRAYLDGDLGALDAIPVETGGTPFQRAVWAALRRIPAGETSSYAALAAAVGRPRAVRAVGMANARNPVALVVPCHRVIGADGSLTGYGGGLERKRWLLDHERAAAARPGAA